MEWTPAPKQHLNVKNAKAMTLTKESERILRTPSKDVMGDSQQSI